MVGNTEVILAPLTAVTWTCSRVLGKVAVTGQTAFRETTLVALLRLGLDVMIS